jgi:hypothetical protein
MVPYDMFPQYILANKDYFMLGLRPKYAESVLLVYAQNNPPRTRFIKINRHPIFYGLDPPDLGGRTVELCRNTRPPQYVDPHPDLGGAHAVCPRAQTIRRGHICNCYATDNK